MGGPTAVVMDVGSAARANVEVKNRTEAINLEEEVRGSPANAHGRTGDHLNSNLHFCSFFRRLGRSAQLRTGPLNCSRYVWAVWSALLPTSGVSVALCSLLHSGTVLSRLLRRGL